MVNQNCVPQGSVVWTADWRPPPGYVSPANEHPTLFYFSATLSPKFSILTFIYRYLACHLFVFFIHELMLWNNSLDLIAAHLI